MVSVDKQLSPSAECAKFVAKVTYADLPKTVVDFVKKDVLDWLGCAIAGSADPSSVPIKKVEQLLGGTPEAQIVSMDRGNLQYAAMCNAYFGHITETDDVDKDSITHPATINIPPALALSEFLKKNGKDLILAITCGFEVMLRIGAAITPEHYQIFHTTSTAGVFGAAMASGKLLGLSEPQLLSALGNAGTTAAGLWQFLDDGAMSKFLHTANAAGNGLLVALLAKNGFTGATQILEGKKGFFAGYARQEPKLEVFTDFGQKWRTALVSFKPYPCCRHIHSAIDAALDVRNKLQGKKIAEATLYTYNTANSVAGKRAPKNEREAKFSLAYCVASALLRGTPSQKDFSQSMVDDPEVKSLESLINVKENNEFSACVPKNWPARLEVITDDGEKITAQVWNPTGDPENSIDWDSLIQKFQLLTEGIITSEGQEKIIKLCRSLDTLESTSSLIGIVNETYKNKPRT
ncbi:MAG: MmgE/PrpD family protein [Burkholderiales bacterium]|nr:MmgE/PrpD family protein [Burkholderiales bacterium]